MITISAFNWVPPFARGYVRDLRIRWALEEAGLPYEVLLIDFEAAAAHEYRDWQPFGQVPAFRDGDLEIFESGAILIHLSERSDALAPKDSLARAKVLSWIVAALNTVEPCVQNFVQLDAFPRGEAWTLERRPQLAAVLEKRLSALKEALGERHYLSDRFTAGDLMMTMVLRELVDSKVLLNHPTLEAYRLRCESRPAFSKALADHMAAFAA
jgi:glutathione S-transferase